MDTTRLSYLAAPLGLGLGLALGLVALAAPAFAQEKVGPDRYAVTVHADPHPATPQAARHLHAKIEEAADAVCGATPADLKETKLAIRRSACWHAAVASATPGGDTLALARDDHR